MKVILNKNKNFDEVEIKISYSNMSNKLRYIIDYLKQYEQIIEGYINDEKYQISLEKLIYIDCIDGKTFLYDESRVYECKKNLINIEKDLLNSTFVRVSKNCIMNISYLVSMKPYPNHRMMAKLSNDETLIVSRKYIDGIKDEIRRIYNE